MGVISTTDEDDGSEMTDALEREMCVGASEDDETQITSTSRGGGGAFSFLRLADRRVADNAPDDADAGPALLLIFTRSTTERGI